MSDEEECEHEYELTDIHYSGSPEYRTVYICIHCDWEDDSESYYGD